MSDRKWKDLEMMVAHVENRLKPLGAIVKYSHKRLGRNGRMREVDATIEYKIGTVPILIIVECRDRKYEQDVTWIEQLVTKKDNLKAQQVIAVSSSGFTKPAIEEAHNRGIELRLMSQVDDTEIKSWTRGIEIKAIKEARRNKQFLLEYYDMKTKELNFLPEDMAKLRENWVAAPIMVRYHDDRNISLQNMIDGFKRHLKKYPKIIQEDYKKALFSGQPFEELIKFEFPRGAYYNLLDDEKIDIKRLEIHNYITFEAFEDVPMKSLMKYTDIHGKEYDQIALIEYSNMTFFLQPGKSMEEE